MSGFISYCQPKLVFPEQKCQLIWHVFCSPVFPTYISTPRQVISLFLPRDCKNMRVCKVDAQYGGSSHSHLMSHPVSAHGVCVYVVETSEMEHVHTFASFTLRPSSSGYGSSQSSRGADLSADGVDCTLLPVKARGTISALYTIIHQLCSIYKLASILP